MVHNIQIIVIVTTHFRNFIRTFIIIKYYFYYGQDLSDINAFSPGNNGKPKENLRMKVRESGGLIHRISTYYKINILL